MRWPGTIFRTARDAVAGFGVVAAMDWARILTFMTETVGSELLARNECLAAENHILKAQLMGRLKLSDAERGPNPARALHRSTPHRYAESVGSQVLSLRHCPKNQQSLMLGGRANGRAIRAIRRHSKTGRALQRLH